MTSVLVRTLQPAPSVIVNHDRQQITLGTALLCSEPTASPQPHIAGYFMGCLRTQAHGTVSMTAPSDICSIHSSSLMQFRSSHVRAVLTRIACNFVQATCAVSREARAISFKPRARRSRAERAISFKPRTRPHHVFETALVQSPVAAALSANDSRKDAGNADSRRRRECSRANRPCCSHANALYNAAQSG